MAPSLVGSYSPVQPSDSPFLIDVDSAYLTVITKPGYPAALPYKCWNWNLIAKYTNHQPGLVEKLAVDSHKWQADHCNDQHSFLFLLLPSFFPAERRKKPFKQGPLQFDGCSLDQETLHCKCALVPLFRWSDHGIGRCTHAWRLMQC
jgi:hypothetical protein